MPRALEYKKMQAVGFSESLVSIFQATRLYAPKYKKPSFPPPLWSKALGLIILILSSIISISANPSGRAV
jgi:hypothetical protein